MSVALAHLLRKTFLPPFKEQIKEWKRNFKREDDFKSQDNRDSRILFGFTIDSNNPVELPVNTASSSHWILTGSTGAGKTFEALNIILSLLSHDISIILVDMKGEMAELVSNVFLPLYLQGKTKDKREKFYHCFTYIDPFTENYLFPFNILKPISGVDISLQAHEVCSLIEETVGRDLGANQTIALHHALKLCIETGCTFSDVRRVMIDPFFRDSLLQKSNLNEVKQYFLLRFQNENSNSINSIINRLEYFSSIPSIQTMLNLNECLTFQDFLSQGFTIFNLGSNVPLGAESLQKFVATLILTRLARAILGRKIDKDSPPVLVVIDEFQECLSGSLVDSFERLLCLSRSKKVFFMLLTQLFSNIARVSPHLVKVIQTNCGLQLFFRMSPEDAKDLAPLVSKERFKVEKTLEWGAKRNDLSQSEQEKVKSIIREFSTLPTKHFYFWNRIKGNSITRLVAPELNVRELCKEEVEIKERLLTGKYHLKENSKERKEIKKVEKIDDIKTEKIFEEKPKQAKFKSLLNLG